MTFFPDDENSNFTDIVPKIKMNLKSDVFENNNNNVTGADLLMEQFAVTLNVYYTPFLIFLGFIGNVLSIIVFFKSKLRLQSTSQYLTALAASDNLFLCQLLPPWLNAVEASTMFTRTGLCQFFVYCSYVSCNLSSWLVVAFTVERFVAVVHPLRRNIMCTVKRARYIIGSLAGAAFLINIPVLRFAVPTSDDCNIDELLMAHAARFNLVDTALSFSLPLVVIVVLNTWIMWGIYRMNRARPQLVRQQEQWPGRLRTPRAARASASRLAQQRITRMLLVVSSVFVMLNLPAYATRFAAYAANMGDQDYSGKWAALQQVCLLLFNTNFGINFVLYCLTGQNFRRALMETFPCLWERNRARARQDFDMPVRASSFSTSYAHSLSNLFIEATGNIGAQDAGGVATICVRGTDEPATIEHVEERRGRTRRIEQERLDPVIAPRRPPNPPREVIQRWTFDNSRQTRRTGQASQHVAESHM